jgi:ferredoxin
MEIAKRNRHLIPYIDYGLCVGCGACAEMYPLFFVVRDEKAWFINHEKFVLEENKGVEYVCPFGAIRIE